MPVFPFFSFLIQHSQFKLNFFFIRAPIGQAYGLTETCAGSTFSEWDDPSVGRVGPPVPCCYIKVCHIYTHQGKLNLALIMLSQMPM